MFLDDGRNPLFFFIKTVGVNFCSANSYLIVVCPYALASLVHLKSQVVDQLHPAVFRVGKELARLGADAAHALAQRHELGRQYVLPC